MSNIIVSLIVISYNMGRELPRTLFTLRTPYQLDIENHDVEIIVVDNGSAVPPCIDPDYDNVRVIRMENPTQSPVPAINLALSQSRGNIVGVMIDGARMASPGLLSKVILAAKLNERTVISTLAFHLGAAVQMESVEKGYNQDFEDRLLASTNWDHDGYELFGISVFAGSSAGGWFDPLGETNALFMRRELWSELGGYDSRFISPGGGLANLDTYKRATELDKSTLVTILGEATFHQFHGGVATNRKRPNPLKQIFHREYKAIHGEKYVKSNRKALMFGELNNSHYPSVVSSLNIFNSTE